MPRGFGAKLWSNIKDAGRVMADNQLTKFGMPDIVKDSDYENNFWNDRF